MLKFRDHIKRLEKGKRIKARAEEISPNCHGLHLSTLPLLANEVFTFYKQNVTKARLQCSLHTPHRSGAPRVV